MPTYAGVFQWQSSCPGFVRWRLCSYLGVHSLIRVGM
uniref:Uncharacterized protein n=1 Tax=Arundo donax TaxID=35708 RepID=A0A0A9C3F6_ARUDO